MREHRINFKEAKDKNEIETCYDLIQASYKYARVPVLDRSLFFNAFDVLHPKQMVKFTLATINGTSVAVSVDLYYKDVIYGWYSGVDRSYSKYAPSEIHMWDILAKGIASNYRVYDFGGAGKPGEDYGVRQFKAKFGGKLVGFGRNKYIHAPKLLWLSTKAYSLARGWL